MPGSELGLSVGKWVLTGNPVRSVVRAGNAARAVTRFGLSPALPTVYVTGGAQGAHAVNELVRGSVSDLLQRVQLIHQCGDSSGTNEDYEALLRRAYDLPTALRERYVLMRYIGQEIGDVYAAADLVVGRAGAGTVNEIAVLRKPAVFIPLAHAANDEQRRNANRLAATGAAVVLDQAGLTPDRFSQEVVALATDPERLAAMAASSVASGLPDPAEHIATLLLELAGVAPVAAAAPDRSL
ncbi:MAG: glycosyltransferase [Chloroflexia bacterium]